MIESSSSSSSVKKQSVSDEVEKKDLYDEKENISNLLNAAEPYSPANDTQMDVDEKESALTDTYTDSGYISKQSVGRVIESSSSSAKKQSVSDEVEEEKVLYAEQQQQEKETISNLWNAAKSYPLANDTQMDVDKKQYTKEELESLTKRRADVERLKADIFDSEGDSEFWKLATSNISTNVWSWDDAYTYMRNILATPLDEEARGRLVKSMGDIEKTDKFKGYLTYHNGNEKYITHEQEMKLWSKLISATDSVSLSEATSITIARHHRAILNTVYPHMKHISIKEMLGIIPVMIIKFMLPLSTNLEYANYDYKEWSDIAPSKMLEDVKHYETVEEVKALIKRIMADKNDLEKLEDSQKKAAKNMHVKEAGRYSKSLKKVTKAAEARNNEPSTTNTNKSLTKWPVKGFIGYEKKKKATKREGESSSESEDGTSEKKVGTERSKTNFFALRSPYYQQTKEYVGEQVKSYLARLPTSFPSLSPFSLFAPQSSAKSSSKDIDEKTPTIKPTIKVSDESEKIMKTKNVKQESTARSKLIIFINEKQRELANMDKSNPNYTKLSNYLYQPSTTDRFGQATFMGDCLAYLEDITWITPEQKRNFITKTRNTILQTLFIENNPPSYQVSKKAGVMMGVGIAGLALSGMASAYNRGVSTNNSVSYAAPSSRNHGGQVLSSTLGSYDITSKTTILQQGNGIKLSEIVLPSFADVKLDDEDIQSIQDTAKSLFHIDKSNIAKYSDPTLSKNIFTPIQYADRIKLQAWYATETQSVVQKADREALAQKVDEIWKFTAKALNALKNPEVSAAVTLAESVKTVGTAISEIVDSFKDGMTNEEALLVWRKIERDVMVYKNALHHDQNKRLLNDYEYLAAVDVFTGKKRVSNLNKNSKDQFVKTNVWTEDYVFNAEKASSLFLSIVDWMRPENIISNVEDVIVATGTAVSNAATNLAPHISAFKDGILDLNVLSSQIHPNRQKHVNSDMHDLDYHMAVQKLCVYENTDMKDKLMLQKVLNENAAGPLVRDEQMTFTSVAVMDHLNMFKRETAPIRKIFGTPIDTIAIQTSKLFGETVINNPINFVANLFKFVTNPDDRNAVVSIIRNVQLSAEKNDNRFGDELAKAAQQFAIIEKRALQEIVFMNVKRKPARYSYYQDHLTSFLSTKKIKYESLQQILEIDQTD